MSLASLPDQVLFGFDLPAEVNAQLQLAARQVADKAQALQALQAAQALAPQAPEVLLALCKFYFYQGETERAESLVLAILEHSARAGGFSADWRTLAADAADWNAPRGPGRNFLYALKALAFIRLRQQQSAVAREVLAALERLDPQDQVGAEVIRALADSL